MSSDTTQFQPRDLNEATASSVSAQTKKKRTPPLKYRPDGVCAWAPCGKPVPGGMVGVHVKNYFCSKSCQRKEFISRTTIGTCEHCNGPIKGVHNKKRHVRFCSRACQAAFHDERAYGPTGPFRELIEEYLRVAPTYKRSTLPTVKPSLTRFFGHVFTTEGIRTLDDIAPQVVTRFGAAQKKRGMTSSNWVQHVRTFFEWLTMEERFQKRNPVIPRLHADYSVRTRQPYEDRDMAALWSMVDATGSTLLRLMFAIGEESGLRASEVINLRVSDLNLEAQTLFVRLPTKNGETRTVPFHEKVKLYAKQWLLERDPACEHDHLLHNGVLSPMTWSFHEVWRRLFGGLPEPGASFEFHRLRHSWATRLVNAGMELPILQQLGGWKSLRSVQIYAKIRRSTVDRQYAAAYAALQAKVDAPDEPTMSLLEFALSDDSAATTPDITVA